jgi:diguanylate cyclase (GGDEF)-like protein
MALKVKIEKAMIEAISKTEFKLLILEESPHIRKALKLNLIKLGFVEKNIYESDNGEDGFAFLMEIDGVDFIIVDLAMPRISGIDFIQSVKKNSSYKHVNIIALDKGDKVDENARILNKFGVYDILAKPFTQDEFFNLFVPKVQKIINYQPEDKTKTSTKVIKEEPKEVKEDKSENIVDELRARVENLESEIVKLKEEFKIDANTTLLSNYGLNESLNDYERLFEKFKEKQDYMLIAFRVDKLEVLYLNFGEAIIDLAAKNYALVFKKFIIGDNISSYIGHGKFIVILSIHEEKEISQNIELAKKLTEALKTQKLTIKDKVIALTFSCGVALRSKSGSLKSTLTKADEKLRVAIKKGGNSIEI